MGSREGLMQGNTDSSRCTKRNCCRRKSTSRLPSINDIALVAPAAAKSRLGAFAAHCAEELGSDCFVVHI